MAKGTIFFIGVVVIFVVITALVRILLINFQEDRKTRAINHAMWTMYSDPKGDQVIEVGVHKVARWGLHTEVVGSEKLVDVHVNAFETSDLTLDEAKEAAKRLADTYNGQIE